jgi:UDP-3-O-[3-hydroxymyristoyl] N-acetylglucosamine deacetylase
LAEYQTTLQHAVEVSGVGLHSGSTATVRIHPAGVGEGISFFRRDQRGARIPAAHAFLNGSNYATSLARGKTSVSTVEHLLSALQGLEIDNARIEVDGPEVPILDGSSGPFVEAILAAGLRRLGAPRRFLSLKQPVSIRQADKIILALPSNELQVTYAIDFAHPAIGYQAVTMHPTRQTFAAAIAPARTFCLLRDVAMMRAAGLALGGSLENALVIGEDGALNGALRFPDEFVRHKVLDLIGDLTLLGMPLRAHVIAFKGGHRMHAALVGRILSERACWSLGTSEDQLPSERIARFAHLKTGIVPPPISLSA